MASVGARYSAVRGSLIDLTDMDCVSELTVDDLPLFKLDDEDENELFALLFVDVEVTCCC
jgi:hypothetical protein